MVFILFYCFSQYSLTPVLMNKLTKDPKVSGDILKFHAPDPIS